MAGAVERRGDENERAERRAAREVIAAYHQAQLRALLERVRAGSPSSTRATSMCSSLTA